MAAKRLQYVIEDVGKTFGGSKKRITWKFWFYGDEEEHVVVLVHSKFSGKKTIFLDGKSEFREQKRDIGQFQYPFQIGHHLVSVIIDSALGDEAYNLRVDGKDFVELPRTSLEEMRREIRDIQNNTVVAPTMKLSDFVSTEKPVHKESKETTPHRPSVAKTTTPPKHAAPAPAPVHAPAPAPAHVPAPSADFDLFGGAPAAASGGWDPFDGAPEPAPAPVPAPPPVPTRAAPDFSHEFGFDAAPAPAPVYRAPAPAPAHSAAFDPFAPTVMSVKDELSALSFDAIPAPAPAPVFPGFAGSVPTPAPAPGVFGSELPGVEGLVNLNDLNDGKVIGKSATSAPRPTMNQISATKPASSAKPVMNPAPAPVMPTMGGMGMAGPGVGGFGGAPGFGGPGYASNMGMAPGMGGMAPGMGMGMGMAPGMGPRPGMAPGGFGMMPGAQPPFASTGPRPAAAYNPFG